MPAVPAVPPAPRPTLGPPGRLARAALLLLALQGQGPSAHAAPPPAEPVLSAHYELRWGGPSLADAQEASRVLEAAWPLFEGFFKATPAQEPGTRLLVSMSADAASWSAAIRAAGGTAPGPEAGGYYDPVSRAAFLYRQPSAWYTRTLLLHEAAHQFHYLARTKNRSPAAPWYVEGLAEHLSHHTWDGTTLRLGVVPLLSLEDRAGKALEAVLAPSFDLEPLVEGTAAGRPESMHLVRFLLEGQEGKRRTRFDALAEQLDQGGSSTALFARAMGPSRALLEGWREWLPSVQQPWQPVHVDWDPRGPRAVRGTSPVVSACRVRGAARRVQARWLPPATGPWRAGALLSSAGPADFTVALATSAGVRVQRFRAGAWQDLPAASPAAPAPGAPWTLDARRDGVRVTLSMNALPVGSWDLPGEALGLALDACTMEFTDLAWETAR